MGGGKGGSDSSSSTVRYAPYVESYHQSFLAMSNSYTTALKDASPYANYVDVDFDDVFYGAGYAMTSFPSLYDMFGKFMAGLDIEVLFEQVLHAVQNTTTIQEASNAHRDLLDDDIEQVVLPRFKVGQRDINAVMSSSFVIGKAVIENARVKKLAEFDADLRYKLIPIAADLFSRHLSWNQSVVSTYSELVKFAIMTKFDTDSTNYDYARKDAMWPFTVLEQHKANVGALQGAMTSESPGASTGQKLLGGVAGGASFGASIGGIPGAAIGGIIGGIGSLF